MKRFENKERKNRPKTYYICQCDCGNKIDGMLLYSLKINNTQSCGCLLKEKVSKQNRYEEFETYFRGWDTKEENCFYIDKIDYEIANKYCWYKNSHGYWAGRSRDSKNGNKIIKLHQVIASQMFDDYAPSRKLVPDHLNSDFCEDKKNDNRRCNLQLKTWSGNRRNCKNNKNNTSGKKGVRFVGSGWTAFIIDNNHRQISKTFKSFEEALSKRLEWEKEFGYIGE